MVQNTAPLLKIFLDPSLPFIELPKTHKVTLSYPATLKRLKVDSYE